MTGKEYLINYMQNHNGKEIYELIKNIERISYGYTDSYDAFVSFLDDEDTFNLFLSALSLLEITQDKQGKWVIKYDTNRSN